MVRAVQQKANAVGLDDRALRRLDATVAKQFQTAPLYVLAGQTGMSCRWQPSRRSSSIAACPDTGLPPPAPGGLYPSPGAVVLQDYAKLMSATIPRATSYQLALESWNGRAFVAYHTWTSPDAYVKTFPVPGRTSTASASARRMPRLWPLVELCQFDYGNYSGPRP